MSVLPEAEAVAEAAWGARMPPDAAAALWLVCWPWLLPLGWLLAFWAGVAHQCGRRET